MENDVRWKQRFDNFGKPFGMLSEFIAKNELNKFEEQGLIQCFEYTFELAWKTMKDYLEESGYTVKSLREAIQTAFQSGLIVDGHTWIDALRKRNIMAHTYGESTAKQAVSLIRDEYFGIIKQLFDSLGKTK
jgi:nucleotidyltransferase substrate binding protein (TIGR01987 family)